MSHIKDMVGQKFGGLTVIKKSSRENAKHQVYWICRCLCGRLLVVRGDNLRSGNTKQCTVCANNGKNSNFVQTGGDEYGVV